MEQVLNIMLRIPFLMFQALIDDQNADEPQSIAIPFDIPYIKTRILNYEPTTLLRNLKASTYGKGEIM